MKSVPILCISILFGLPPSLLAQTVFSDSGYSSVTIVTRPDSTMYDRQFVDQRVKTLSYHLEHFTKNRNDTNILLSETSVQHSRSDLEGEDGIIFLSARVSDGGSYNRRTWEKTVPSNFIEYHSDYLVATTYGCCGAENVKRIYRYSDGAELMTLTSDVGEVSIPNTQTTRYVGYWDVTNSTEESEIKDTLLLGILTLVDPDKLTRTEMIVKLHNPKYSDTFGVNAFDSLSFEPTTRKDSENYNRGTWFDLWSADGNKDPMAYSNFAIKLKFEFADEGATTVVVPVKGGKFDISNLHSKWFDFELR